METDFEKKVWDFHSESIISQRINTISINVSFYWWWYRCYASNSAVAIEFNQIKMKTNLCQVLVVSLTRMLHHWFVDIKWSTCQLFAAIWFNRIWTNSQSMCSNPVYDLFNSANSNRFAVLQKLFLFYLKLCGACVDILQQYLFDVIDTWLVS